MPKDKTSSRPAIRQVKISISEFDLSCLEWCFTNYPKTNNSCDAMTIGTGHMLVQEIRKTFNEAK